MKRGKYLATKDRINKNADCAVEKKQFAVAQAVSKQLGFSHAQSADIQNV
jgi:hypothetical protein